MTWDYLVVGAGIFGATCARELADRGRRVLVIEKRGHVAGNCHTTTERGVLRSVYGGHIFHTDNRRIWDYVNRFAEFRQYEHRVKASYQGTVYSFPPNRMTCQQLGVVPGTPEAAARIKETFFDGYSAKQWGRPIDQVPGSVIRRIPIRDNWDDRYFADEFQGLPAAGYTAMVEKMLEGIRLELNTDYLDRATFWDSQAHKVIFTGPIDALCGHVLGKLDYRSLHFEDEWHEGDYQGCATLNYTEAEVPYTRVLEWKHFWPAQTHETLVTREYPAAEGEPYYPVNNERNQALYAQYRAYAAGNKPHVILGGRLGSYKYLDMHQAIGAALRLVETELSE
jgi:UDP-galactopyranose mutase